MTRTNALGQPIGDALPDGWTSPPPPSPVALTGRTVAVVPLDAAAHGAGLHDAFLQDATGAGWTYMSNGPYDRLDDFLSWLDGVAGRDDPLFFAFLDRTDAAAIGYGALVRVDAPKGCVEIGSIRMSPRLQRTPMSTEAIHLLADYVFGLGYRRCEWKCDALNAPSRSAAARLGFVYEGVFRKATHYKGRSRDTAWFSITEDDWPAVRAAHRAWLSAANFDADGVQKRRLAAFMTPAG